MDLLAGGLRSGLGLGERLALAMHLVAEQARNRGKACLCRVAHFPWAGPVDGRYHVADSTFEVRPVAPQAVVHQKRPAVVLFVQENLRVRGAVGSGLPIRELLLVAGAAPGD